MENSMSETRYTEQHEWIGVDGEVGAVGITRFAVEQLGDIVFVEPPEVGRLLKKGEQAAVVESVKAASEVYSPVSGEVLAANAELAAEPARLNADPEGEAWFYRIKIDDPRELSKLMTADRYAEFVKGK
jgi:glycine cleavage system H protein